jgi:DNA-binding SARP family transcriptional activator/tetratricopeptide (TPR) repeat protein
MRFGLLGPLQVCDEGRDLQVPAPKQRVLLAAMLLTPRQAVSAARLSELVWDGFPPRGASDTLRSYVMRLRKALGPSVGSRIVTADGGYLVRADDDELDTAEYVRLCGLGEAAVRASSWQRAEELLSRADSLWRGSALADVPCPALQMAEAPRLEELRLQATEWRIEAELQLGRSSKLVPELRALTSEHPLRERFHHQLMTALHRSDRAADALAAYRDVRKILVDEIGIEPGPDLQLLHQRILNGDGAPAMAADSAATNGHARPASVLRNLPLSVPDFVGRTAQTRELTGLLSERASGHPQPPVAVISGPPGVGKTALAVFWAHQAAGSFPDGQLYLNLNGFGPAGLPVTPGEAIRRMLDYLQVPQSRIPASPEGQAGLYRTLLSQRRLLLILDNAKDAEQVRPLLPASADSLALVTSRSALTSLVALEGARSLTLPVFSDTEAHALMASRLGHPDMAGELTATTQIVSACGRLPLALAIATALVATRSPRSLTAIASTMSRAELRLETLDAGDSTSNVRAVFSWSYRSLTPATARMFRLLAEHPGPDITVAAAASLAGVPVTGAGHTIRELADLHLVSEQVPGRFSLHDLIRLYAGEMLELSDDPLERGPAGERMLDHYLHTAWAAALTISPSRKQPQLAAPSAGALAEALADADQASSWLSAEHQVLMRMISYAADAGADVHAWQLPWALTDFLDRGGHWPDLAASEQTALAAALRRQDREAEANAHRYLGRAAFQLQQIDEAVWHLTRACELRRALDDGVGEAGVSIDLARVLQHGERLDEAIHRAQHALLLYQAAQHRVGQAAALNNLGMSHTMSGNYAESLACCQQALELNVRIDHQMGEAQACDSLGFAYQQMGRPAEAIPYFERSLGILRKIGDRYLEAVALTHLGDAYDGTSDAANAHVAWREALGVLEDLNHPDSELLSAKVASWVVPAAAGPPG